MSSALLLIAIAVLLLVLADALHLFQYAQLVNEGNVVALTSELLNYLVVALPEHKASLCDKVRLYIITHP
jgi:hypothetical protein